MIGQKLKREHLAKYYGGIIQSGEWYLAEKADAIMDEMEHDIKIQGGTIKLLQDRIKELECEIGYYKPHSRFLDSECDKYVATIQQRETRIKELEYQLSDKGRKNSELFSTNAELRTRIKELEAKLALTAELVDSAKEHLAHCEELGTQLGTDHFVDANKMMWVSVKDRMPEDQQQVLCIDIQGSIFHSFHETYENKRGIDSAWWNYNGGLLRDVTHWMPLPPPPKEESK